MTDAFVVHWPRLEASLRDTSDVDAYAFAALGRHPAGFAGFAQRLFAGPTVDAPDDAPLYRVRIEPRIAARELVVEVHDGPRAGVADALRLDAFDSVATGWAYIEHVLDLLTPAVNEAYSRLPARQRTPGRPDSNSIRAITSAEGNASASRRSRP